MMSFSIVTAENVGQVVHYYKDGRDDYYSKQGDGARWQGRGAETLGLAGPVDSATFQDLLRGVINGQPVARASTRHDSKTRLAIDLTFSAPKSVSLQALLGGDARIVAAHDQAVARALAHVEEIAQARTKIGGRSRVEHTRNISAATFRHETSRAKDPQLHTHAVLLNLTQRKDGRWRALRNDEIVKSTKYLGALYRTELAMELQRLGYGIRREKDGFFELAHISREQLKKFSQRSEQIERALARQGVDRSTATTAQKQIAALETRDRKTPAEMEAIRQEWLARAREYGISFDRPGGQGTAGGGEGRDQVGTDPASVPGESSKSSTPDASISRPDQAAAAAAAARRGVRYAINHLTERQAVVYRREVLDTALKHVIGAAGADDIVRELNRLASKGFLIREAPVYRPASADPSTPALTKMSWERVLVQSGIPRAAAREEVALGIRQGRLVPLEERYTTQTALERERSILKSEHEGRGTVAPLIAPEVARELVRARALSGDQRAAILAIVTTTNRVIGIQGHAGTGKSHMLRETKNLVSTMREAEARSAGAGNRMVAVAPYAAHVRAMRNLGVEARTIASFLNSTRARLDQHTILVVDEAGTVPTRQVHQLLRLAKEHGSRVVLLGDTQQTRAIEAGRPFDQLQNSGMQTATIAAIQRQTIEELRKAVELAALGRPRESLAHIRNVHEIKDDHQRRRVIARDFTSLPAAERERTIIVSGTNEARKEINEAVRQHLDISGVGTTFDTLSRRDSTRAERAYSQNYSVGELIQPERHYPRSGLVRGKLYKVVDTGPGNRLTVRSEEGTVLAFCPLHHRQLSVYSAERKELAAGDRVRITRNDAALDLANGDRFLVLSVSPDMVTLTNERRVVTLPASRPLHLEYAYATTIHSSQGTTAERVLFDANSRSRTTTRDVFYVAVSRARSEVHVYTDSRTDLPEAIAREAPKYVAFDVLHPRSPAEGASTDGPAMPLTGRAATGVRAVFTASTSGKPPATGTCRSGMAEGQVAGAGRPGAEVNGPSGGLAGGAGRGR